MSIEDQLSRIADALEALAELHANPRVAVTANGLAEELEAPIAAAPTYEDVRVGVLKLAETRGNTAAVKLLERYGVKNGKQLKPEQYPAVLADLRAEFAPVA